MAVASFLKYIPEHLDGRDWEEGGDVRAASWRRANLDLRVRVVQGDGDKILRLATLLGAKDDEYKDEGKSDDSSEDDEDQHDLFGGLAGVTCGQ